MEEAKDDLFDFDKEPGPGESTLLQIKIDAIKGTREKIDFIKRHLVEYKLSWITLPAGYTTKMIYEACPPVKEHIEWCNEQIELLNELAALEESKLSEQTPEPARPGLKFTGSAADLIRLLNALYSLNVIEFPNGQRPTKIEFMKIAGDFFSHDLSRYESTLNQAKGASPEAYLKIFDRLIKAAKKDVEQ